MVGLSTVWDEFCQTFYVTDEGQLLSDIPEDQQNEQTVQKGLETYEALSVVQLGQDNAKKYVIRSLATLGW